MIRGCVPKKMLVYGAHFAEDLEDCQQFGWTVEGKSFDWVKLRDHVLNDVERIEGVYTETLEKHDVTLFHERGYHAVSAADVSWTSGSVVGVRQLGELVVLLGLAPQPPRHPRDRPEQDDDAADRGPRAGALVRLTQRHARIRRQRALHHLERGVSPG